MKNMIKREAIIISSPVSLWGQIQAVFWWELPWKILVFPFYPYPQIG